MKIKADIIISRFQYSFLSVILFIILINSCTEEQGRPVPKKMMPEKDLASILYDLYLTDGILSVAEVRDRYSSLDSITAYLKIIENHGYTKEAMDLTLEYYFVKKPKRLIRIYDNILGKLSEIDMRLSNIPFDEYSPENNKWPGLPSYTFPDPSGRENPGFSIPLNSQGYYTIAFTITVYPFDQTVNPCFSAWFCSADSSETGKKYFLPSIKYIRDGLPHTYTFTGNNDKNYPVLFKGSLFDCENNPDCGERYGRIERIRFSFSPGV